ncbi:MAG: hypothetical protein WD750_05905 [Gammaproteobacteria bacterium]
MIEKAEAIVPGPLYPDLFDGESPIWQQGEAVCLGCGCTDSNPCRFPNFSNYSRMESCAWVYVRYDIGIGACSQCEFYAWLVENWDAATAHRSGPCQRCRRPNSKVFIVADSTVVGRIAVQICQWCWIGPELWCWIGPEL